MRTLEELKTRLANQGDVRYIYDPNIGYIAWRYGTGDNLEMIFIEVAEKRKGHGKTLYRQMCKEILARGERPYHSVFGFRLASNDDAKAFYDSMGWTAVELPGRSIYGGDGTVIFWIKWEELLRRLGL